MDDQKRRPNDRGLVNDPALHSGLPALCTTEKRTKSRPDDRTAEFMLDIIYIYISTAKLRFNEFINQTWTRPLCMNQFWKPNSVIWRFSGDHCWTAQSSSRYCLLSWWLRGQSTHGRGGFVTCYPGEIWSMEFPDGNQCKSWACFFSVVLNSRWFQPFLDDLFPHFFQPVNRNFAWGSLQMMLSDQLSPLLLHPAFRLLQQHPTRWLMKEGQASIPDHRPGKMLLKLY